MACYAIIYDLQKIHFIAVNHVVFTNPILLFRNRFSKLMNSKTFGKQKINLLLV